ncbi:class I adenylate-forming enzyme family protein [Streptomyces sp. NPDC050560]|uniref:class I adenylate-forming enzyme family protein n=1 Tax=Streptomyces sp. NPDC050560 TaxID=3365630 RepID=UPI0037A59ACC
MTTERARSRVWNTKKLRATVTPGRSIASGPSLDVLDGLTCGPGVDALPARAARHAPHRVAIRAGGSEWTYGELDARVTRCAAGLRELLPDLGSVVAVPAVADPAFPTALYGTSRSGNISVVLNPLWREDGLAHALRTSRAQLAVVTPQMYRVLCDIRFHLPYLDTVVLTHPTDDAPGVPVLGDLAPRTPTPPAAPRVLPDAVACVMFTSGTTGASKAVMLTHRDLTVNAAQTAFAHQLDGRSVTLNCLPTYHLMHLNSSVCALAKQVLHPGGDPAGSVQAAVDNGVTHYYSLPVRLAQLAMAQAGADRRKPVPTLRAILSGGSALPVGRADELARRFRVPVVQGYGLAETSPLSLCDPLDAPRKGSCGVPLPGTECRIVHPDTREVRPLGETGEVELRGPQLMKGYLDAEPLAPDAWFATGDVGRMDGEGRLYLVDRIKDVFKCDNFLVSPTEVEAVLRIHPAVDDCVVVGREDPLRGALACALVETGDPDVAAEDVAAFVNGRVPYYQRLWRVEIVDRIPRSATGKVQRLDLRDRVARWTLPARPPENSTEGEG